MSTSAVAERGQERRLEDRLMLGPDTEPGDAQRALLNSVDPNYSGGPWCDSEAYEEWSTDMRAIAARKLAKAQLSGGLG